MVTNTIISRGQRLKLVDIVSSSNEFIIEVIANAPELKIDLFCFSFYSNEEYYVASINQPRTPCGGVSLNAFSFTENSVDFVITLEKLPINVDRLMITAAIDGDGKMSQLIDGHVSFIFKENETARFNFDGSDFLEERALMLLEIYRKNNTWKIHAVGQGFKDGLDALIKHLGSNSTLSLKVTCENCGAINNIPKYNSDGDLLKCGECKSSLNDVYSKNKMLNFLDKLKLTPQQREQIRAKLNSILDYQPVVGVLGKTGAGKSSLCNSLFGKDVAKISDVEACTRSPQELLVTFGSDKGIILVDMPGVGETNNRDDEYSSLYKNFLPKLDIVLWLIKADDRALSIDETFYNNIVKPYLEKGKPFFVVLNQVDKIEPVREWNTIEHIPSSKQKSNIELKKNDITRLFNLPTSKIIPVSVNEKYNVSCLIEEIIYALPNEKKTSFTSKVNKEHVSEKAENESEKGFFQAALATIKEVGVEIAVEIAKGIGQLMTQKAIEVGFKWLIGLIKK